MKPKPLTKDDRELYPSYRPGFYEEDLKSALEEFENLMHGDLESLKYSPEDEFIKVGYHMAFAKLKKAFPAIYERDEISRSTEVDEND